MTRFYFLGYMLHDSFYFLGFMLKKKEKKAKSQKNLLHDFYEKENRPFKFQTEH
jgi:hypothetical protein